MIGPRPEELVLEVKPQPEFQLPRRVGLGGDSAKRRRAAQRHVARGRVARLHVVQDVGELEAEGGANFPLFPYSDVFRQIRIQIPGGKAPDAAIAARSTVLPLPKSLPRMPPR